MKRFLKIETYNAQITVDLKHFQDADIYPRGQYFFLDIEFQKDSGVNPIRILRFTSKDEAENCKKVIYRKYYEYLIHRERITNILLVAGFVAFVLLVRYIFS